MKNILKRFIGLFIAGVINATGVTLLLAPVNLFDSGISGTSFLLDKVTPPFFVMSFFLIVLNVPFYILGYKKVGWKFVINSLFAIGVYSLFSFIFKDVMALDFINNGSPFAGHDLLLASLFGGLVSGVGSGLVIRMGGAIDGIEVMAVLFAKKLGLTVGTFMMIYNTILYVTAALVFQSWTVALYSIIAYTVGNKTIDFVVEGLDKAKAAFIITEKGSSLPELLSAELGQGVTLLDSYGAYSKESKTLIYCVVNRFEISKVKKLVREADPKAFVSIAEVSETVGGAEITFKMKKRER